ncbi:hypothetical protein LEP1GSC059_3291 [Leptospira noguchii serovar Panama str. CZ214]|uniref:Uncharacterized protein n=1 Tax=Leptospira noguchii serovar Panama str. CZ214 TaxID=1001595 RepID=T0GVD0_9LEPT|nr:hypothetical protein LEP1GSC059_3291 [Leptospira noguchii serovar Panama str. CZ214]
MFFFRADERKFVLVLQIVFKNVGTLTNLDFTDCLRKCGNSHKIIRFL